MAEEVIDKTYGQPFTYEVGDMVVKIMPSELDNRLSKVDLSKPNKITKINDIKVNNLWYQILEIDNGGFHNALDFRPQDSEFTDEAREHMKVFFQNIRKITSSKAKAPAKRLAKANPMEKISKFHIKS